MKTYRRAVHAEDGPSPNRANQAAFDPRWYDQSSISHKKITSLKQ
jgi:hypothetical protein